MTSLHPDQVRIAEAQLDSDRAALRVAQAEVARREAMLGTMRKRFDDTTIRAPFAGQIAKRHLNAGEYVKENTPVFTLVALDPLKYTGTVSERFAPELATGQRFELIRRGLPRPDLRRPGHPHLARRRGADAEPRPRGPRRQCATTGYAPASSPRASC